MNAPDPYAILRGHQSFVNTIQFNPFDNNNRLVSGSGDGEIRYWDIDEKKCIHTIDRAHNNGTVSIEYCGVDQFQSQGRDGTIKQWTITESSIVNTASIDTHSISLAKFSTLSIDNNNDNINSNQQQNLVLVSSDIEQGVLQLWDFKSNKQIQTIQPPINSKTGMAMALKLLNNNVNQCTEVFGGYESGEIYAWDLRNTEQPIMKSEKLHDEPILSIDIKGSYGISGGGDTNICEFNLNYSKSSIDLIQKQSFNFKGIGQVKIRNDGRIFATGGWDKRVRIYNCTKHTPLAILKYHTDGIYTVDFSKSNILASSGKDMKIALWSIYN